MSDTHNEEIQQRSLTMEDIGRLIDTLKHNYTDNTEEDGYLTMSPEEYQRKQEQPTILCLPSRVHNEDLVSEIILDDPGYQHLHLPIDEASVDWFKETFRDRLNANGEVIVVTSKIYGE